MTGDPREGERGEPRWGDFLVAMRSQDMRKDKGYWEKQDPGRKRMVDVGPETFAQNEALFGFMYQ